jgi:hypothetical protein
LELLEKSITRRGLGVPEKWDIVQEWIDDSRKIAALECEKTVVFEFKNAEIPILKNYEKCPGEKFWENFPKFYPDKPAGRWKKEN